MDSKVIKKWLSGSGTGSGSGSGDGDNYIRHKIHNGNEVFYIDAVPTVILNIHGNYAKGYIINSDFTATDCFVAKGSGYFAHGTSLREAVDALQQKIMQNMSEEERIDAFCKTFDKNKSYKGSEFFDWHNRLTGSCLFGRKQFVADKNLSLDSLYTVKEFIELTQNAYGGNIIKKLSCRYN